MSRQLIFTEQEREFLQSVLLTRSADLEKYVETKKNKSKIFESRYEKPLKNALSKLKESLDNHYSEKERRTFISCSNEFLSCHKNDEEGNPSEVNQPVIESKIDMSRNILKKCGYKRK